MARRLRVKFPGPNSLQAGTGSYALTGNAVSFARTVPAGTSDFAARVQSLGTNCVRSVSLLDPTQLGTDNTSNYTNYGWFWDNYNVTHPVIDSQGLRFDIPAQCNSNGAGSWFTNYSPDRSVLFGANSEHYVQMRVKWNSILHDTIYLDANGARQGGIKIFDVGAGDVVGFPATSEGSPWQDGTVFFSNTYVKTVVKTYAQTRLLDMYNKYSVANGFDSGLYEYDADGTQKIENAMPAPYCVYSVASPWAGSTTPSNDVPGCWSLHADEWFTLMLGITLGPLGTDSQNNPVFTQARRRLWAMRDSDTAPTLLIDFGPSTPGYYDYPAWEGEKIGKVNIFPYMTNKSQTQVAPGTGQMWVKELIISTVPIPFPGTLGPQPNTAITANLAPNTAFDLTPFNPIDPVGCNPSYGSRRMVEYGKMLYDAKRHQLVAFGGGHACTNTDAVYTLNLSAAQPAWTQEYLPTPQANWTQSNYDYTLSAWKTGSDGGPYPRPSARHTYDELVMVGDELIMLCMCNGNATDLSGAWVDANGQPLVASYETQCSGQHAHYNFASKTWMFSGVGGPGFEYGACEYDPLSGKVVMCSTDWFRLYDPVNKVETELYNINVSGYWVFDENGSPMGSKWLHYAQNMVYCPLNQKHYYFNTSDMDVGSGPQKSNCWVFEVELDRTTPTNSTIRRVNTAGPITLETAVAWDSANKVFGIGPISGVFYTYDPIAKVWAQKTVPQAVGSVQFHCMDYDPIDNCYIFVGDNYITWAYRWA